MAALKSVDVDTEFGDGIEVGVTTFNLGNGPDVKLACLYDIGGHTMVAGLTRRQVLELVRALLAAEQGLD
jgi:hypothetical protein